uniref:Microtubule-associated protein n=1 Tax=Meloidogyne hapla TaxID=6305 RepID=A0A1I8B5I4_MELHA
MRSSSAKPIPRSQAFNNNNPSTQNNIKPTQNGNGKLIQQQKLNNNRDISRNRSSTVTKQNGASNGVGVNRAPSMPPRIINRRYAHVKSKVNSITDHSPSPSEVKIFHEPLKVNATPKVGSLANADHMPLGGNVRILQRKLNFRETARPRVDAKSDIIIPKSEKRIPTEKLVWKAEAKVGSLINAGHQPGGGQNKIFNEPVKVNASAKVGSLDNVTHVPGGGNISDYARSISGTGSTRSRRNTGSSEMAAQSPSTLNADIDSLGGDSEINH